MNFTPQGRTELLVSGGACACCAVDETTTPAGRVDAAASAGISVTLRVDGMTCANCVRHVTDEIAAVDGVDAVDVHLVVGGVSTVTVRSGRVLDDDVIAAAVAEAGYEVVAR
jgi:copper chaperone